MPEVEIVELHHDRKLDKPSGTAARTAELLQRGRGQRPRADPLDPPAGAGRPPGGRLRRRRSDADDPPRLDRPQLVHAGRGARLPPGRHAARAAHGRARGAALAASRSSSRPTSATEGEPSERRPGTNGRDRAGGAGQLAARRAPPSSSTRRSSASRQVNPEINAIIHDLSDEARAAAAGDLPDGPFKGVPFLLKDLGAAFAGQPLHMGMQAAQGRRTSARRSTPSSPSASATPASSRSARRTRPELGILPTTEPEAYGATKNPWDTTAPPAAPAAARPPRSPPASCRWRTPTTAAARSGSRLQLRPGRPEADAPADQRGPAGRRQPLGPDRRAGRLAVGARHRAGSSTPSRGRPRATPTSRRRRSRPTSRS